MFFPIHTLCKPRGLWKDPCADMVGKQWQDVAAEFVVCTTLLTLTTPVY